MYLYTVCAKHEIIASAECFVKFGTQKSHRNLSLRTQYCYRTARLAHWNDSRKTMQLLISS